MTQTSQRFLVLINHTLDTIGIQESIDTPHEPEYIGSGNAYVYAVPAAGQASLRWDCLTHCSNGTCLVGGVPTIPHGTAGLVSSTKFEATFAENSAGLTDFFDASMVDGFNLAYKLEIFSDATLADLTSLNICSNDCSTLTLSDCPSVPMGSVRGNVSLLATANISGNTTNIACMAPCKKAEALLRSLPSMTQDEAEVCLGYCQYGPNNTNTCDRKTATDHQQIPTTRSNGQACMTAQDYDAWTRQDDLNWQAWSCLQPCLYEDNCMCNGFMNGIPGDGTYPGVDVQYPVSTTDYVSTIRSKCPWTYTFSYDDFKATMTFSSHVPYVIVVALLDSSLPTTPQRPDMWNTAKLAIGSSWPLSNTDTLGSQCQKVNPPNNSTCASPDPYTGPTLCSSLSPGGGGGGSGGGGNGNGSGGAGDEGGSSGETGGWTFFGFHLTTAWLVGGVIVALLSGCILCLMVWRRFATVSSQEPLPVQTIP